jgi:hypothetical protein
MVRAADELGVAGCGRRVACVGTTERGSIRAPAHRIAACQAAPGSARGPREPLSLRSPDGLPHAGTNRGQPRLSACRAPVGYSLGQRPSAQDHGKPVPEGMALRLHRAFSRNRWRLHRLGYGSASSAGGHSRAFGLRARRYGSHRNPPILHRKEAFLAVAWRAVPWRPATVHGPWMASPAARHDEWWVAMVLIVAWRCCFRRLPWRAAG